MARHIQTNTYNAYIHTVLYIQSNSTYIHTHTHTNTDTRKDTQTHTHIHTHVMGITQRITAYWSVHIVKQFCLTEKRLLGKTGCSLSLPLSLSLSLSLSLTLSCLCHNIHRHSLS